MGAWKSSDGGTIGVWGSSTISGSYTSGTTTIVSAGANAKGVTLNTMNVVNAGGTAVGWIEVDGVRLLGARLGNETSHLPREIFVPAGKAVTLVVVSGTVELDGSYTIH